jgi:amidase
MATSAGSLALAAGHAPRDAHIVERLRAAGAVILGKTNLSEWANFRSSQSASGWSGRGGQTRNPYVLDRSPCGSSSGTGAAIAASLAAVGVGTETDGSIVCPSSVNGLVGIKPTVGLVSRAGIIPISASQDTAGPMARSVADAALLLGVLAGPDPRDPVTLGAPPAPDYVAALSTDALRGARIGVARRGHTGYSPATDAAFARALDVLRAQGAVVVDPADVPNVDALGDCEMDVLLFEFKAGVEAYLASRGPDVASRSLDDLIAFNTREAARELPWFGQDLFERAARKGPLSDPGYRAARDRCRRLAGPQGIDAALHAQRLDALVAPTGGPAWPIDPVNGDHFTGGSSQVAAVAGYPAVTVPMGDIAGLPVGITFFGTAFREAQLASIAYAYEQATRHRRPPAFRPTLDVSAGPEPVPRPVAGPPPEPSP